MRRRKARSRKDGVCRNVFDLRFRGIGAHVHSGSLSQRARLATSSLSPRKRSEQAPSRR
jgi:hypothetical protein